jgi:hypothetical protein
VGISEHSLSLQEEHPQAHFHVRIDAELATLTEDVSAGWVPRLLDKYPTAQRIAQAHRATLEQIPQRRTAPESTSVATPCPRALCA